MVYTVKLKDEVLYCGTSAEDAANIESRFKGAKSYTEGVEIQWLPIDQTPRKSIKAVTAVSILKGLEETK